MILKTKSSWSINCNTLKYYQTANQYLFCLYAAKCLKSLSLMNFSNFRKIKMCCLSINQVFHPGDSCSCKTQLLAITHHLTCNHSSSYLQSLIFLCFDGNLLLETRGVILEMSGIWRPIEFVMRYWYFNYNKMTLVEMYFN